MKKQNNNALKIVYKPLRFFGLVYLITWGFWFLAAYLSHNHPNPTLYTAAMMPGLFAPVLVTAGFIFWPGNKNLRKDFFQRLLDVRKVRVFPLLAICAIMASSVVFAVLISLGFGQSIGQLAFTDEVRFSAGAISAVTAMLLASIFEEIGWRGYGVDALLEKLGMLKGSLLFGVLWSFWHFPLAFVKDYSVNMLVQENILYAVNFFVSIIPLGIVLNWLYIKSNRSTACLCLFHLFLNFMQTATKMTEFTSCIQTGIIILYAALIVRFNREIFLPKLQVSDRLPMQHVEG